MPIILIRRNLGSVGTVQEKFKLSWLYWKKINESVRRNYLVNQTIDCNQHCPVNGVIL